MLFSFRRDSDTRPSQKSSQTARCFLRSIRTATLRPFASVTNWIPLMASLSHRWSLRPLVALRAGFVRAPSIAARRIKGWATRRENYPTQAEKPEWATLPGRQDFCAKADGGHDWLLN